MWKTLAELGVLGLPLPAEFGGFGGGAVDTMSVMEAIGEALVVEPYLATVGLGAQFVARAGTPAQKERILPAVVEGKLKLAFAQTEIDARYDLAHVATRARKTAEGGYVIDGEKRVVLHGPCADLLVVSARTPRRRGRPGRHRRLRRRSEGARRSRCAAAARSTACGRRTSRSRTSASPPTR